jgi:streptogramin lyase
MFCSVILLLFQTGAPTIHNLEIATYQGGSIEIHGSGFGTSSSAGILVLQSGAFTKLIPSSSAAIRLWKDHRIVLDLPADVPSGTLRVLSAVGLSPAAKVEVYAYDWFDIPPTSGTNASPLSIAVDAAQRVWVNQEFHLAFQRLDLSSGVVTGLSIPQPPPPGPFASTIFADSRTQMSILGEDVMVDPLGRIWFTQGGANLYSGIHPNHSRVVCVLPDAPGGLQFRVYNAPNDWNEVIGLTWDPTRNWVWFAEGSLAAGSRIVGFDPDLIPWDNHFDFSTSLSHLVGTPGLASDPVYHYYTVPNTGAHAAHLLVKPNGNIWFTQFWGSAIGRLNPTTGVFNTYPVPAHVSRATPAYVVGAGPWQIVAAPNGDIVFNEFFDATITRFDITRADDPLTWQLDANGLNPGMIDREVPRHDRRHEQMHSIAYDPAGNLWYTLHTANTPGLEAAVGYLNPAWSQMTRFSPMDSTPGSGAWSAAGIAVDSSSGNIFLAEFWRKRIGRLQYVPPLP